jgi:hypothetical protein
MKVDQKGHTTILKDTKLDLDTFVENIVVNFTAYQSQNLILDLTAYKDFNIAQLKVLQPLLLIQKKNKKSLITVLEGLNYNEIPEKYNVVPSLLEAHDLIEMDEIERDLGF